ncbi:FAD-binding protein [Candidatus Daviesbacteria bacterium]|nr:FAD-binding protein [Candidatus Daviesbacteria bacterium]
MIDKVKLIINSFGETRVKANELLSNHTFLRIGGPASAFYIAFTQSELTKIIETCRDLKVPFLIFGTGSKIAISDQGFLGVAIKNRTKNIQTISVKGKVTKVGIGIAEALIEVESGVSINKFIEYLTSQNLSTYEFINIPGTIGGNLFLNHSLQTKVESIKVLDQGNTVDIINARDLDLRKHIILSAVFRIKAKN